MNNIYEYYLFNFLSVNLLKGSTISQWWVNKQIPLNLILTSFIYYRYFQKAHNSIN